ncbi:MAG TPA: hypothetical protein VN893_25030 [Bryobacteraceae bacterium]|nr:hypothetical protein [Bryobacteraceae bacterium]
MKLSRVVLIGFVSLILAGVSSAQNAISAKAGMVNYVEGTVSLDGQPVKVKIDNFPSIRNGSELRTEEGRAEVLLGPGVFMRLGENSAVRMVSNDIMNSRLEFLGGSVIVESAELEKNESVGFTYKGSSIDLLKQGVYRLDGEPAQISVYDGEARVMNDGQAQVVKRAHLLRLDGVAVAEKFDEKAGGDSTYRWARRRAEYLAVANVSAARSAEQYGFWGSNNWIWNPFFGTFTYLPMGGMYDSFWGYRFWSPQSVYMLYVPRQNYGYTGAVAAASQASASSVTASRSASAASPSLGAGGRSAPSAAVGGRSGLGGPRH